MSATSSLGKKTMINLFFGIFLQAVIALSFDAGGIVSGTIASFMMNTKQIKWIVLMYGPLLAARGDIAVLAGKLGTGLHLGTVKPSFRKNTPIYKSFVASTLTIAMLDAIIVGTMTYLMNILTFPPEYKVYNPTLFFVIPILVMSLASMLSTQITSAVSFFTYKKGLNPDVYVVPVMSTINNILITIIYALILKILKPWTVGSPDADYWLPAQPGSGDMLATYIAIIPVALALAGILYVIIKNRKDHEYRKMMKESIFAVFASGIIGTITGFTLSKGEAALEAYPQLLVAFPALIGTVVDQNAITINMLITDFSAGYVKAEVKSIRKPAVFLKFLGIGSGGVVVTILLAVIGTFIKWGSITTKWYVILVIIVTVIANVLAYVIVGSLIYVLAIVAFKREIDPDNFAIPLAACLADLACAAFIILFSFLILPGVSSHGVEPEAIISFVRLLFNF